MARKLKVAEGRSISYKGELFLGGDSFSAQDDDPEVDGWIERGYCEPTAKGGRDKVKQNRRKRIEEHRTAKARGLDPQGLEGRGDAPPASQAEMNNTPAAQQANAEAKAARQRR
jgi:hypothetical protein